MTDAKTLSNLVDLLQYWQTRQQRRLDFERRPSLRPGFAAVTPFRRLTAHEVAHRQRMVRHLANAKPRA
jgi:hypothetical protein